jgi:signal transduction histidine kinase
LADAVRGRVASITAPIAISVHATDLPELPGPIEEAAYRVANEAIANVLRHAGAQNATVELGIDSGCLVVSVRDDGTGFEADAAGGIGLASMRTRAEVLGGSLRVDSSPAGTSVTFTVPITAPIPVPVPTVAAAT